MVVRNISKLSSSNSATRRTPLTTPVEDAPSSPKPWTPEPYQLEGVKHLISRNFAGLFLRPGMRKTSITLAAIKILLKKKLVKKVLVIAPRRVCLQVWPAEIEKWEDFNHLRYQVLRGRHKADKLDEDADIYITNFEQLGWLLQAEVTPRTTKTGKLKKDINIDMKRWKELGFDMLVIDELSKFKHLNSQRSRMLKTVSHLFTRRVGLTGSPATNGLMGLFGQMFAIDRGKTLGVHVTHFRREYYDAVGTQWNKYGANDEYVLKEGAKEKMFKAIAPTAMYIDDTKLLKLPTLIENPIKVTLPPEARELYDAMEDEYFFQIEERVITAANAGVCSGKLHQLANGAIFFEEFDELGLRKKRQKGDWIETHTEKLQALSDLVDEMNGEPLLVAYHFQHDLARLKQVFGKDIPVMGGGTSDKRAIELEKAWNQGKIEVLLGHPMSMGHGLNFQENCGNVAWFNITDDFELYDQFIRRVLRSGNHRTWVVSHLIAAASTVDIPAIRRLHAKAGGQQELFDALLAYRAERTGRAVQVAKKRTTTARRPK